MIVVGRSLSTRGGFTLIELLIVIAIIGILSSIVLSSLERAREKAYFSRAQGEFHQIETALANYYLENGKYPDDVDRDLPSGIEEELSSGNWPEAPWPGSVYDWDNWDSIGVAQISIRFCDIGETDLDNCNFPNDDWAEDFGVNSAVYFCLEGDCRSHVNEPEDYPGYCINCSD
ncbi:MAG: type II secretion system protein [Candidatus Campbellbacteria bacterium]|nr:type II secretion system protein [Candidatus Campbellbacteria bacterium]